MRKSEERKSSAIRLAIMRLSSIASSTAAKSCCDMKSRIVIIEQPRLVDVVHCDRSRSWSLSVAGFAPCALDCPRPRDFFGEEFAASPTSRLVIFLFVNTTVRVGHGHGTTTTEKLMTTNGLSLSSRAIGLIADVGAIRKTLIPDNVTFDTFANAFRTSTALSLAVT